MGTKTTLAVIAGVMLLAAGAYGAYAWIGNPDRAPSISKVLDASGGAECCAGPVDPSHPTLDPALFMGEARQAYEVARKDPALLMKLHCYCGCEKDLGHRNLLDCFRTDHGSHCDICMGEAILASRMAARGVPVEQIRDALREKFSHGG